MSRKFGCCVVCGNECFNVTSRWPSDHRCANQIREVSGPKPDVKRYSLLLLSGSQSLVTTCGKCEITPENLPDIWKSCVEANAREDDPNHRVAIGAQPIPEGQREHRKNLLKLMNWNVPLGVLYEQEWSEICRLR
jgi:hypothetical protein